MKRQKIVAGNWKMHLTLPQAVSLASEIAGKITPNLRTQVMVAPSFPFIHAVAGLLKNSPVKVAAQNAHWADAGAFTGEVSVPMLKSAGAQAVILGHSERRQYFGETGEILARKVENALKHRLPVIFCVGENEAERESGNHFHTVESQIREALGKLIPAQWELITLAYEPVWAIGTGKTATPEQAQEMHAFIRELVQTLSDENTAQRLRILYGGSVKPGNAAQIFAQPDVDGGLIGGASLKADDFAAIIEAAEKA